MPALHKLKSLLRGFLVFCFAKLNDLEATMALACGEHGFRPIQGIYMRLLRVEFVKPLWTGVHFRRTGAGPLRIGRGCRFGHYCLITAHGPVEIGDFFGSGPHLLINSGSHELISHKPVDTTIRIGSNVWVGARATIVENSDVGDNSVIAAGAVVTGKHVAQSLIAGVPGKTKKAIPRMQASGWNVFGIQQ
jgi:acetyltransferase-like isoleucine patch superfamily enzyme